MRTSTTIVILMITLSLYGQKEDSKWNINFNYQNDSYLPNVGSDPPSAFGISSFRGWSAGVDRTIIQNKYLKLNAGLGINVKNHIITGSRFNQPFQPAVNKGGGYYYLTVPFTLKYTKSKVIQPSLSITPGVQIFNSAGRNNVSKFHRPPGINFIELMPGVEIRMSDRVKIFAGFSLTNYDFFGGNGKWGGGFQVGIKINIKHKKRSN